MPVDEGRSTTCVEEYEVEHSPFDRLQKIGALFFGGLAAASLYLPVLAGLPAAAIDIINAAIALFITARAAPGLAWLLPLRRTARGS